MTSTRDYPTERIRNVAVLGHGGSGKTTLIDALCYVTGTSKRRGDPKNGPALTMFTEEEIAHGISIQGGVAHADWDGTKINLLDTPGYLDFTGEALAATRVADGALITVSATSGVEVGTEKVWEYCEERSLPRVFFVSMMDKEHADFEQVYEDIKRSLTDKVIPVEIPIGAGEDFRGIINLFSGRAHVYKPGSDTGEYDEVDVPEEMADRFEEWRTELFEAIATTDDSLLETYLEDGGISREQAIGAMKTAMARGEMIPLFSGAGGRAWGTRALLQKLVELMPSPAEAPREIAQRAGRDEVVELTADDGGPFAALVFKTASEPHVGELYYLRVFSGCCSNGIEVLNPTRDATEKLDHLAVPQGKERLKVPRLHAGDIGVVSKLKESQTNDTLCSPAKPLLIAPIAFPEPDVSTAIRAASRKDEDRIGIALQKLQLEDPTFQAEYDGEIRQTIMRGLGELHLDVQMEKLQRKFGVSVTTEPPRIPYRETIAGEAEAQGRFKKQTGGAGQFGDCHVRIRPRPRGEGYHFKNSVVGGAIPSKFIPSVDKGVQEAARKGVVAGYPVVDFEIECFHGSHHSVDSSDVAFQVAGSLAFQKSAAKANPVLLEPIMEVEIRTPEDYVGDVIGDLNHRRGRILGIEPEGRKSLIRAHVPLAELYKYGTALRSMTQGRATHRRELHGYEEVPKQVAQRVIDEAAGAKAQAS
jgi:elongation factor G